jgi:hypothetical protein
VSSPERSRCWRRSWATSHAHRNPQVPLSSFRRNGLGFSDATQLTTFAGFLAKFFFLTLYMQNVLGSSPIRTGVAYLPLTFVTVIAAGISSQLLSASERDPHRRRLADHRRRRLLALVDPRPRLLPRRPAPPGCSW